MPAATPLLATDPRSLGAYTLTGRIGEGGQGVVYEGRGLGGERVAVKLLHARLGESAAARRLFERETEAVRRVAPFCTAAILGADTSGSVPYIVSEYIDGPSLSQVLSRQGPLSGTALDRLAIATATALAAIHEAGVVHRDFKPGNVLLGPDGPRVIDFGVARALDAPSVTATGTVGTPAYMAPEQIRGDRAASPMDLFAWGCTVACAANGQPPFGNDSIPAVMHRILHEEPALGALSGALRDVVGSCLAKDPAQRPTASQVLGYLLGGRRTTTLLADGASAIRATPTGPWAPPAPRHHTVTGQGRSRRSALLGAGAVAAAMLVAVPLVLWQTVLSSGAKGAPHGGSGAGGDPASLLPSAVRGNGTLTALVTAMTYPPLVNGMSTPPKGLDAEIAAGIARELHLTTNPVMSPVSSIPAKLQTAGASGLGVIAIGATPVTVDNTASTIMVSYLNSGTGWAAKKGHAQVSASDLCGKTVAVQTGTTAAGQFGAAGPIGAVCQTNPIHLDTVTSPDQAAAEVRTGRAEIMAADTPVIDYEISQSGGVLAASGKPYGVTPLGIQIPQRQQALAEAVRAALGKMISDGSYGRILATWGVQHDAITTPAVSPAG